MAERFSRPGEPLLWPGQFIIAIRRRTSSAKGPGRLRNARAWMRNGSFACCDVSASTSPRFMSSPPSDGPVSAALGREVTRDEIEAWLVGRWPDGKPLVRQPHPVVALAAVG